MSVCGMMYHIHTSFALLYEWEWFFGSTYMHIIGRYGEWTGRVYKQHQIMRKKWLRKHKERTSRGGLCQPRPSFDDRVELYQYLIYNPILRTTLTPTTREISGNIMKTYEMGSSYGPSLFFRRTWSKAKCSVFLYDDGISPVYCGLSEDWPNLFWTILECQPFFSPIFETFCKILGVFPRMYLKTFEARPSLYQETSNCNGKLSRKNRILFSSDNRKSHVKFPATKSPATEKNGVSA